MMRLNLTKDMLDSIKRLNDECNSRVEFEKQLIQCIENKNEEIEKYKKSCDNKDREYEKLEEEFKKLQEEACSFRRQVEEMFLKEREMFVWENGVLRIMDTSY